MKAFRFRYQSLLDHRSRLEDQARGRLAAVTQRSEAIKREQAALGQLTHQTTRHMSQSLQGCVDVNQIRMTAGYIQSLRKQQEQRRHALEQNEQHRLIVIAEVQKAMRERQVIERLRDRAHDQWKRDVMRKHTAELDECASNQRLRQIREEDVTCEP